MTEEAKPAAGFLIDGREYEPPTIDSLNLDESCVLYDYCGLSLEDFLLDEEDEEFAETRRKMRNPAFTKALLHIAYQRGNQEMKPAMVKRLVGEVRLIEVMSKIAEEVATSPPEQTEPENAPSSSVSSTGPSGDDSTTSSDELAARRTPTGITESATSATLVRTESAS